MKRMLLDYINNYCVFYRKTHYKKTRLLLWRIVMRNNLRIILSNFKAILELKKLVFIIVIFIIAMKKNSFDNLINLSNYIRSIFYGPNDISTNIIELLIWSIYQFYLIYIIGDYLGKEFGIRNIYTISRIGSKIKWYVYNQLTLVFVCLVCYLTAVMLITIYAFIRSRYINILDIKEILNIWLILSISSYFILTVYLIIFIITKNNNLSFILIIISLYLSIEFGSIFKIDAFIPLNQGILSKHFILHFSFLWSYIYLSITTVINLFIIKYIIFKNDLLSIIH